MAGHRRIGFYELDGTAKGCHGQVRLPCGDVCVCQAILRVRGCRVGICAKSKYRDRIVVLLLAHQVIAEPITGIGFEDGIASQLALESIDDGGPFVEPFARHQRCQLAQRWWNFDRGVVTEGCAVGILHVRGR